MGDNLHLDTYVLTKIGIFPQKLQQQWTKKKTGKFRFVGQSKQKWLEVAIGISAPK